MRKMSESNKLQQELHRLRENETNLTKLIHPWQDEPVEIATQEKIKVKHFTSIKETVDGTEENVVTQELV